MGVHRTCGEPNEIKKHTHPNNVTALFGEQGRSQLLPLVPRLTELKDYNGVRLDHMAVSRNAQTAIDTIVWRP